MTTDLHARRITRRTMRRVYGIWFVRRVLPILALEVATLVFVITAVQSYMSFGEFFRNAFDRSTSKPLGNALWYWADMMIATEHMIKLFIMGAAAAGWLVVRDTMRVTRQVRSNFLGVRRVS
ncbi:MAG: hypothetical protein EXS68_01710 [Candidatus Ryanbacteria bacterium]|nr:hypothetical protein [Candidatus Ryanbacteria bacterium]